MTDEQERVQPSGVWATAVGVARVRALETERENALFRDPLAQAFATAGGLWPSSAPLPDDEAARRRRLAVSFSIVIRTKFLDDLLRQASASGVRQVVLLGAGMDSRAFRTDWPEGTRLFEVDTSAPLDFKASVLRQERAVARLVCAGKSNREVAAELIISVKTVGYHLGNTYAKLGVNTRTQLAALLNRPDSTT